MSLDAKSLKLQLAGESLRALVRLRGTGQAPTAEDSPLLMQVWQLARDLLVADGPATGRWVHNHGPLRFTVTTSWDANGRLRAFRLHDRYSGALLLAGDRNGPTFVRNIGLEQSK